MAFAGLSVERITDNVNRATVILQLSVKQKLRLTLRNNKSNTTTNTKKNRVSFKKCLPIFYPTRFKLSLIRVKPTFTFLSYSERRKYYNNAFPRAFGRAKNSKLNIHKVSLQHRLLRNLIHSLIMSYLPEKIEIKFYDEFPRSIQYRLIK